jgi:hypothetical protein
VSTRTVPEGATVQTLEPDTVELHVRNVPRAVWLKARQEALASRLRFGKYIIKLLENAGPVSPPQTSGPNVSHPGSGSDGHSSVPSATALDLHE